jgi:hypothetical protein
MTGVWGWSRKRTINNLELFLKMNKSMSAGFAEGIGLKCRDLLCDTEFLSDFLLEKSGRLNCVERVRRKGWKKFSTTPKSLRGKEVHYEIDR